MGLVVSSLLAVTLAAAAPPKQAAPLTAPYHLLVESRGTLLVADGNSGRIVRIDPRTGRRTVYARGLGHVYALAAAPDGLYATTTHAVVRFRGGTRQVVAAGFQDPLGLAVAKDGTVYVVDSVANQVIRIELGSGGRTVLASTGLDQPIGAALTTDGSLLVADSHRGRVVRVGDDGTLEPVLEGLTLPVGVTVGPRGAVYVVDHVRHDAAGKILLLRPDGTTIAVSAGKIKAVAAVAVGRTGILYGLSFLPPFVGRLGPGGVLVPFRGRTTQGSVAQPRLGGARAAFVGEPWTVRVTGSGTLVAAQGARRVRAAIRAGRVTLRLPAQGAWTLSLGGRRLGWVTAGWHVREPFKLDVAPDGTLVVTGGRSGRVLRLDARTGSPLPLRAASRASSPPSRGPRTAGCSRWPTRSSGGSRRAVAGSWPRSQRKGRPISPRPPTAPCTSRGTETTSMRWRPTGR